MTLIERVTTVDNNERTQGRVAAVHAMALVLVLAALLVASCSASSTTISAADPIATSVPSADSATLDDQSPADSVEADSVEANKPDDESDTSAPTAEQTPAEADSSEGDPPTSTDGTLNSGESGLVLLDAGAEPRTELRLMIAASCGEVMTVSQTQELTQLVDGTLLPSNGAVGNLMELSTTATPNGENYDIRSEVTGAVSAPGTPAEVAAALNPELALLIGLTTFATIDDRGRQIPGTTRLEGGESLGPLRETVEAAAMTQAPLPAEPVGVGARWETETVTDVQGLMVMTTTVSEVVAIEGTVIEMIVTGTQQVAVGSEMNVQGITAEVTEWRSDTTGEVIIDLATISPISQTTITDSVQGFEFTGAGGGSLSQTLHIEVSVAAEPNDGCTGRIPRP